MPGDGSLAERFKHGEKYQKFQKKCQKQEFFQDWKAVCQLPQIIASEMLKIVTNIYQWFQSTANYHSITSWVACINSRKKMMMTFS